MSSIIINALETGDEVLVTESTSVKGVESAPLQMEVNLDLKDKMLFQEKMRDILSCKICCEMKRCPMYQCKHGHLMCAGCFNDIVAESRLQNEIACCPTCQATITKDFCFRNVAVEKTISELPMACPHCSMLFPPENFKYHEVVACKNRPAVCSNAIIGCSWKGTTATKQEHESNCKQVSCSGYEILESLTEMDKTRQEEENMYNKMIELLSVEKITYIDLQLKRIESEKYIMETSKFTAFENQWLIRVCCHNSVKPTRVFHQLILKTKLLSAMNFQFMILSGPYNDMEIKPHVYPFKSSDDPSEKPREILDLPKEKDRESFMTAKRINIRIFMFVVK